MKSPKFDLDKIKFATDAPTFEKAVALYGSGKVIRFRQDVAAYSAVVLGTRPYAVSVEARGYDYGHCECYLGQNDTLCKHMVAVAIYAVNGGKPLTNEDKRRVSRPASSGKLGILSANELKAVKKSITSATRYIKSYEGPSSIWFSYQNSLSEGCNRLGKIASDLPVGEQTAGLLVDILLRLDERLSRGGVDDSDGTVGGCMQEIVFLLQEYAKLDPNCARTFKKLKGQQTCFDWGEPLLKLASR